jgi:DNA mismatch repair ATPase MutS
VFDSAGRLILEGDALQQLHIDDLIKTIDRTRTAAGGRMLADRLRNPYSAAEDILSVQRELAEALADVSLATCGPILKGLLDIERIAKTLLDPDAKRAKSFVASAIKTFEKVNELYAHHGAESCLKELPERLSSSEDDPEALAAIARSFAQEFATASGFVATKDFLLALVELVRDGYVVPELDASIEIAGLRYPVAAPGREPFIANAADEASKVLYSYNGTGKSTYMRSFGSALVLAQAGFPVPAARMRFRPLLKIFTRLSHRDMVGRGLSTFEVDALELSHIVSRADARTLVLAEDVVSSDSLSNATISTNFVRELLARDAVVVAATHCTEVATAFEDICWHFPVRFVGPSFVFERTLTQGLPPARAYGLEMAFALGVNAQLLVRPQAPKKVSRYNAKLVVDHCAVCGDRATQTHHIRPQKDFAPGSSRDKNQLSNLAPLCDRCHDRVHHGHPRLRIDGYRRTSRGVKLVFTTEPDDILADLSIEDPPELM